MTCRPQPYCITSFHFEKSRVKMSLEEQQNFFIEMVNNWRLKTDPNFDKWPRWFMREFCSRHHDKGGYWNTVPDGKDKTFYFLLPKKDREKWSTGGRLATSKKWIKTWEWEKRCQEEKTAQMGQVYIPREKVPTDSDYVPPVPDYQRYKENEEVIRKRAEQLASKFRNV